MRVLVIIGSMLNLAGVAVAVFALRLDWKEYGRGDLLPWAAEPFRKLRAWITPGGTRHVEIYDTASADDAITVASGSATRMVQAQTLTIEDRLDALSRKLDHVANDLTEQGRVLSERISAGESRVTDVLRDGREAVDGVREMTRRAAVGTLRLQLFGLTLIGVGTIISTLPTVLGWT